jgi:hypothetical protein
MQTGQATPNEDALTVGVDKTMQNRYFDPLILP